MGSLNAERGIQKALLKLRSKQNRRLCEIVLALAILDLGQRKRHLKSPFINAITAISLLQRICVLDMGIKVPPDYFKFSVLAYR
jgi:hypothetical protein